MGVDIYTGNEKFAFVSYAHDDEEQVEPILEQLSKKGVRIWYDKGIKSGNWRAMLVKQIESCRVMMVFLSHNYSESSDCKRELNLADDKRKDFVVVRLDDIKLTDELSYILSGLHYRDSRTVSVENLVAELCSETWAEDCRRPKEASVPVLKRKKTHLLHEMSWDGGYEHDQQDKYNMPWGPERKMYENGEHPPYGTLNSEISPIYGDERRFIKIKEHDQEDYTDEMILEPNKTYDVRILYHNNADFAANKTGAGLAILVRAAAQLPLVVFPAQQAVIKAGLQANVLRSDGDEPSEDRSKLRAKTLNVWDSINIYAQETPVFIEYKLASAKVINRGKANGKVLSSRLFSEEGTYIGVNELNGVVPGGEEFAGYVEFHFRTYSPDIDKDIAFKRIVSLDGLTWQSDRIQVKKGSYLTFRTSIRNNGEIGFEKAFLKETFSPGLELRPGSVKLFDYDHAEGIALDDQAYAEGKFFNLRRTGLVQFTSQARVTGSGKLSTQSVLQLNKCTLSRDIEIDVID